MNKNIFKINYISKILLFLLFLNFINNSFMLCEISERGRSFSSLLSKSELIVLGEVKDVTISKSSYSLQFEIIHKLFGNSVSNKIIINQKMYNGLFIPDVAYPQIGEKYIVFLQNPDENCQITNGLAGVFDPESNDGLQKIISEYNNSRKLFSKENSTSLINLFYSVNQTNLKEILLIDLKNVISIENAKFIEDAFNSENQVIKIFGILQAGRFKLANLKNQIEDIIKYSNNERFVFHALIALGDYEDISDIELISMFLQKNNQEIRRVSIDALGKYETEKILTKLINAYNNENDYVNRLAIIEIISKMKDKEIIKNVLGDFAKNEKHPLLLNIISKDLYKY